LAKIQDSRLEQISKYLAAYLNKLHLQVRSYYVIYCLAATNLVKKAFTVA